MGNRYYLAPKDELMHYGILGMKWGVRRYQNKDGTLTEAGKKRVQEATKHFARGNKEFKGRVRFDNQWEAEKKVKEEFHDVWHPKYLAIRKKYPSDMKAPGTKRYRKEINDMFDPLQKEYRERFVSEFADATLKDLRMRVTPQAKAYAEDWVRKNERYKWII